MDEAEFPEEQIPHLLALRKSLHDLNNRVSVILATSELLQMDRLGTKAQERCRLIEQNALQVREILKELGEHYFP